MFDPTLPYNDLPLLPLENNFNDPEMLQQLVKSSRALAKLDGIDQLNDTQISKMMISPFLISESVQSNSIENIHTTVEAFYKEEVSAKSLTGSNKEVANYKKAIMYWFQQIINNELLLTKDIVAMQKIIEPKKPWIQSSPDKKIQNSLTKEIIYTPPQWQQLLLDLIGNLDKYINDPEMQNIDPLLKVIIIHYQFESIHPFTDWNGRTGRMIIVLYLILQWLLSLPILYISAYINTHKDNYYNYLKEANYTWNLKPLIIYMLQAIEHQSLATIEKIKKINRLIDRAKYIAYDRGIKDYELLIEAFIQQPYFTLSSVQRDTTIPERTLRRRFQDLEKAWIIMEVWGTQGSYIYYELVWLLPILSDT